MELVPYAHNKLHFLHFYSVIIYSFRVLLSLETKKMSYDIKLLGTVVTYIKITKRYI